MMTVFPGITAGRRPGRSDAAEGSVRKAFSAKLHLHGQLKFIAQRVSNHTEVCGFAVGLQTT